MPAGIVVTHYSCDNAGNFASVSCTSLEPCHLWLRYSFTVPQTHLHSRVVRGVPIADLPYYCFVAYWDVEQSEPGDTVEHTFTNLPWPVCRLVYFYFWGTVQGEVSPSTTAWFTYHPREGGAYPYEGSLPFVPVITVSAGGLLFITQLDEATKTPHIYARHYASANWQEIDVGSLPAGWYPHQLALVGGYYYLLASNYDGVQAHYRLYKSPSSAFSWSEEYFTSSAPLSLVTYPKLFTPSPTSENIYIGGSSVASGARKYAHRWVGNLSMWQSVYNESYIYPVGQLQTPPEEVRFFFGLAGQATINRPRRSITWTNTTSSWVAITSFSRSFLIGFGPENIFICGGTFYGWGPYNLNSVTEQQFPLGFLPSRGGGYKASGLDIGSGTRIQLILPENSGAPLLRRVGTDMTWEPVLENVGGTSTFTGGVVQISPFDSEELWLLCNRGFFKSNDGGITWIPWSKGLN